MFYELRSFNILLLSTYTKCWPHSASENIPSCLTTLLSTKGTYTDDEDTDMDASYLPCKR